MDNYINIKLTELFIILLVTLGPEKIILPFYEITEGLNFKDRLLVAIISEIISALIIFAILIFGSFFIKKWQLSNSAIAITGGLIMFYQGFAMSKLQPTDISFTKFLGNSQISSWRLMKYVYPIVIPVIITPAGITALLSIECLRYGINGSDTIITAVKILSVILTMNFFSMFLSPYICKFIKPIFFRFTGWIFSIFLMVMAVHILTLWIKKVFY